MAAVTPRTAILGRIRAASASANQIVFACPAGMTAIVKGIALTNFSGADVTPVLDALDGTFQLTIRLTVQPVPQGGTVLLTPYFVMIGGDVIVMSPGAANVICWLGGTLLHGVQPINTPGASTQPAILELPSY